MTARSLGAAALAAALLSLSACGGPAPSRPAPDASPDLDAADDLAPRLVAVDGERIAVAGVADASGAGAVSVSLDAGRTWTQRDTGHGEPTGLAIAGQLLWMSVACDGRECLLASDDEGRTWRDLGRAASTSPSLASASRGAVITREPGGDPVVEFTEDGGATWRPDASACTPLQPAAVVVEPDRTMVACVNRLDDQLRPEGPGWDLRAESPSGWKQVFTTADATPPDITTSTLNRLALGGGLGFMDLAWITEDGGVSWSGYEADGRISGTDQPRPGSGGPAAVGGDGVVYALFTVGMDLSVLERSDDRGATWAVLKTWDQRWLR
jgi:hypothetical protein